MRLLFILLIPSFLLAQSFEIPKHHIQLGASYGAYTGYGGLISFERKIKSGVFAVGVTAEGFTNRDWYQNIDVAGVSLYPRVSFHPAALFQLKDGQSGKLDPYVLLTPFGMGFSSEAGKLVSYGQGSALKLGFRWHFTERFGIWTEIGSSGIVNTTSDVNGTLLTTTGGVHFSW